SVHMAHALRRISYATCDPEHAQFSFLAREPKGHFSLQYCHSFLAQSADQIDKWNITVSSNASGGPWAYLDILSTVKSH
ncbi:hypothetical protein L9F63_022074, partial [Diploptera punctata]